MSQEMNKAAAIFGNAHQMREAIQALTHQGFSDISVLIKHREQDNDVQDVQEVRTYSTATYPTQKIVSQKAVTQESVQMQTEQDNVKAKDPNAVNTGSITGGVLGAVAGLAALMIPGVGPVLATGTLASAVGAMAAGGALGMTAGALGGLLKDEGIPAERVDVYRDAFDNGKGIIIVDAEASTDVLQARDILSRFRPEHVDTF